jgi:hypothetical protein
MTETDSKKSPTPKKNRSGAVRPAGKKTSPKQGGVKAKKKRKKVSTPSKGGAEAKDGKDVTVKTFATEIEKSGVSWFESSVLTLSLWMGVISVTALTLGGFLAYQSEFWNEAGVPSDPLAYDWSDYNDNVDLSDITKFLLYCKGMAMKDGDIRECLKLAASFITAASFIGACENVFMNHNVTSSYDTQSFIGCLLTLVSSKASIRRDVRLLATESLKKAARTPEDVLALDRDVSALSKVLRDQDKKNKFEIDTIRATLKKKMAEVKAFEEETLEFRDFMKEYYSLKAGTVTPAERVALVSKYHNSEKAKAMYSLDQFVTLYCAKTAAQKVQRRVKSFRSDARFTQFGKWAEKFESSPGKEDNEEDEDMDEEQPVTLNQGALDDLI